MEKHRTQRHGVSKRRFYRVRFCKIVKTGVISCNVIESNDDAWTEMKGLDKIEFLILYIYIEKYTVRENIFESFLLNTRILQNFVHYARYIKHFEISLARRIIMCYYVYGDQLYVENQVF